MFAHVVLLVVYFVEYDGWNFFGPNVEEKKELSGANMH
jgi:hypothetical protein